MKRIQVNILHAATSGAQALSKLLSNLHNSALAAYGVQLAERSASLRYELAAAAQQKEIDITNAHSAQATAHIKAYEELQRKIDLAEIAHFEMREEICDKLARINDEIERVVNARTDLI